MSNKLSVFTLPDNHLSADVMYQYLDNQLTPNERHMVEDHLLDCNLCNDALAGLSTTTAQQTQDILFEINYHLKSRTQPRHPNTIVQHLKNWGLTTAILFLILIAAVMVWLQAKKAQPVPTPVSTISEVNIIPARPQMGTENYKNSIIQKLNNLAPEHLSGEILVSFTVNPDGSLGNVRIINGLTPELNAAAIRLIKEGPVWQPAKTQEKAVAENKTILLPIRLTK